MRITAESATQMTATDKQTSQLIMAPVVGLIGVVLAIVGFTGHVIVAGIIGLVFILIGVAMLLTRKQRTIMIDKSAGTLIVDVKSITKKSHLDYKLADVAKVQLLTQYRTSRVNDPNNTTTGAGLSFGTGNTTQFGNTQTTQTTQLIVLLHDGTSIDIADGSRSMSTMSIVSKVPNQETGQRLATFMGVQFEEVGPPTLGQGISAITHALRGESQAPSVAPAEPSASPPPAANPPAANPPSGLPNQPGFAMPHSAVPGVPPPIAPPVAAPPPASPPPPPAPPPPPGSETPSSPPPPPPPAPPTA